MTPLVTAKTNFTVGNFRRKISRLRDLSPEKAAILKSLYQFRESKAKKQDRPPFKVISHQALVDIANACPKNREDLAALPSINERLVNRYGRELVQAVWDGKHAPPESPPSNHHLDYAVFNRIDTLREWRKNTGRKMGVPSDVVLPRDVLTRIAQANPNTLAELETQMKDVPYRFNHFGKEILHIIQ